MLCSAKNRPSILIHYEDPCFPEQQFRPVSFDILSHIAHIDKGVSGVPMILITETTEEDKPLFRVSNGTIKRSGNNHLCFSSSGTEYPLDFSQTTSQNEIVLETAKKWGFPTNIPVYDEDFQVSYKKLKSVPLAQGWVGALTLSRAEVTQFLVCYILFGEDAEQPAYETGLSSRIPKRGTPTTFWAWYPSPKPQCLETWLKSLTGEMTQEQKENVTDYWTPLIEGFYRMAVVGKTGELEEEEGGGESEGEPTVVVKYDDPIYAESEGYFEGARESTRAFDVVDGKRGKLSISVTLALRTKDDVGQGTWGFSGIKSLGWLMTLPDRAKDILFGPRRSPKASNKNWINSLKAARRDYRGHESVYPFLRHDAECNAQDTFFGGKLLDSEKKHDAFSQTKVALGGKQPRDTGRREEEGAATDPKKRQAEAEEPETEKDTKKRRFS